MTVTSLKKAGHSVKVYEVQCPAHNITPRNRTALFADRWPLRMAKEPKETQAQIITWRKEHHYFHS